jgi:sugar lactone lactonase YvrE
MRQREASRWRWGFAGLGLLLLVSGVGATTTREFVVAEEAEFLQGTLEGLGVTSDGFLVPGPGVDTLATELDSYVWRLVKGRDGYLYAATGSEGHLFRIDPKTGEARSHSSYEYELFALATEPSGAILFAGAPNGTVRRLEPGAAESRVLFDAPEGVVWSLVRGPDGTIYAGTGDRGRIYAISPEGQGRALYGSPETHIVSLAWGPEGRLLAGTDSRGLLLAVDPSSGEAAVLYDAPQEEIAEILVLEDGSVLFAANGTVAGDGSGEKASNGEELSLKIRPVPEGPVLYRRKPDGTVTDLWHCPEEDILSLAPGPDGSVWVGTGSRGVLFRVRPDGSSERVLEFGESQVLSLLAEGSRLWVGTGNGGALYRLRWDGPRVGRYTSRVFDAGGTARWGIPRVEALLGPADRLQLLLRSGATQEVGEGWSPWLPVAAEAQRAPELPPARFLQWRLVLRTKERPWPDGPRVYGVRIPYRRPNRPPVIRQIVVSPKAPEWREEGKGRPGTVTQTLPGGVQVDYTFPESANRNHGRPQRAVQGVWARVFRSAVWEAEDPDGDGLRFEVAFQVVGEEGWTILAEDLEDPAYTWDASAWPDGRYRLRVRATDAPDNPPGEALTATRISAPFEVDNTPPELEEVKARLLERSGKPVLEIRARARDGASPIRSLEYSLDGRSWEPLAPVDGILDGLQEEVRQTVDLGEDPVPHFVAVRARDAVGNARVARAVLEPQ